MSIRSVAYTEEGLKDFVLLAKQQPYLTADEEAALVADYQKNGAQKAADTLVLAHLRKVISIARKYVGYGLPLCDLVSEGCVGLIRALDTFDLNRGFRFVTYSQFWIKASINQYIFNYHSMVPTASGTTMKKLFFNLRRIKADLAIYEDGDMKDEQVAKIARLLDVPARHVVLMNRRLQSDLSLNAPASGEDAGLEQLNFLVEQGLSQEAQLADFEEKSRQRALLKEGLSHLSERERNIFFERRLKDPVTTLEDLSRLYGITKERVRQIEVKAFEKIQKSIKRDFSRGITAMPRTVGSINP